jgi:phosphoglycolate phosphatase-like HAD superfamily hydrolase
MTVLFWDIDGTLLTTNKGGVFAWDDAVKEITGRDFQLASMRIPGMTDYQIAVRTLESLGLDPEHDLLERLVRRYESLLPASLPRKKGHVLRNVREILESLHGREDFRLYLLTGNTRGGAEAKLTHYGLWSFFPSGAFAEDSGARATIAARAMAMARQHGPVDEADVFVVGDTPHDIECANAIGVRTIAVATGGYDVEELKPHNPWRLYSELPAPDEFLRLIESAPRDPAESTTI